MFWLVYKWSTKTVFHNKVILKMPTVELQDQHLIQHKANLYRTSHPPFAEWAKGCGVIQHSDETQVRVFDLCQQLLCVKPGSSLADLLKYFIAADHLTNAAMWLVVHMTYTEKVDLSGKPLASEDFKQSPQGHTGGSLNMVPAYVGYMVANAISGFTRSWLMGQGHCVAAIEAINILLGNVYDEQTQRYPLSDDGLSQLVKDFYSYAIDENGRPDVPLGSHVNAHTAGGLIEGGYLGFAELQYVHMPLPGERLVAFLSDGAFEEQRGSDWASRWWRREDCGLVTPVMIANGRRIDQRSTMYQQGGLKWFYKHLQHNGFHPIAINGRDPASYIWGILESEARLTACSEQLRQGAMSYPVHLPYLVAETEKGYGFYGAGTNAAHGTPLPNNPRHSEDSRQLFNQACSKLWTSLALIEQARDQLNNHTNLSRVREKDHALLNRDVSVQHLLEPTWQQVGENNSPMVCVDQYLCELYKSNDYLRPRVGNPDEMRSNCLNQTLDYLKHRVIHPEAGLAESIDGKVITALNEEAVVSAALANKGGINLVATYEAFAPKMLGALRQEIIFARHQKDLGRAPRWLSVPIIATSHTWENGKNEQSHQDPLFGEALLGEMSDMARVLYPADANSALAALQHCYQTQGQLWALTIPKQTVATIFSNEQAQQLIRDGATTVIDSDDAEYQLVAIGAYQLAACLQAARELKELDIQCRVSYLCEPGRFRVPRDEHEVDFVAKRDLLKRLFPTNVKKRIFVCHTRPEIVLGVCRPLDLDPERTIALGYANRGGTLNTDGLLQANYCDSSQIKSMLLSDI